MKGMGYGGAKSGNRKSGSSGTNENNTGKQFFHNRTKKDNSLEGLPKSLDISKTNAPS